MSIYTTKRAADRAEACRGDGDWPRIIREHEQAAKDETDPDVQRIARGFALVARRNHEHEKWKADAYARLARGEELADPLATLEGLPLRDDRSPKRKARWRAAAKEIQSGNYERPVQDRSKEE